MKLKNSFKTSIILLLLLMSQAGLSQLKVNTNNVYIFDVGQQIMLIHNQKSKYANINIKEEIKTLILFNRAVFDSIVNTALESDQNLRINKEVDEAIMMLDVKFNESTKLSCSSIKLNFKNHKTTFIHDKNNSVLNFMNSLLENMPLKIYNTNTLGTPQGEYNSWIVKFTHSN